MPYLYKKLILNIRKDFRPSRDRRSSPSHANSANPCRSYCPLPLRSYQIQTAIKCVILYQMRLMIYRWRFLENELPMVYYMLNLMKNCESYHSSKFRWLDEGSWSAAVTVPLILATVLLICMGIRGNWQLFWRPQTLSNEFLQMLLIIISQLE